MRPIYLQGEGHDAIALWEEASSLVLAMETDSPAAVIMSDAKALQGVSDGCTTDMPTASSSQIKPTHHPHNEISTTSLGTMPAGITSDSVGTVRFDIKI